jgi:hypothetical protein
MDCIPRSSQRDELAGPEEPIVSVSQGAEGFGESGAGEAGDVDAIGGDDGVGLLRVFCGFFVSGLGAHGGIIAHWFFVCNIESIPNTTLVQLKADHLRGESMKCPEWFQYHTGSIKRRTDRLLKRALESAFQYHTGSIKRIIVSAKPDIVIIKFQYHTGSIKSSQITS